MSKIIKLKKGFDIKIQGKAENAVDETLVSETYAIKPTDFIGFEKPKVLVKVGDKVKAGQPLYYDKSLEKVKFASPVSGEVVDVKRGEKRKLLEIIVKADAQNEYVEHKTHSVSDIANLSAEDIKEALAEGGVWPNIIQRPYAIVANPEDTPKSIFISGFDTHPLAPDATVVLKGQEEAFKAGMDVLKKLTKGSVHLNIDGKQEIPTVYSKAKGIQVNKVTGPHPAGNVGVQIHHIDPINKGDVVWTVSPYGVAQIGKFFLEGKYDASRVVAVAGQEIQAPKHYKTYTGASISTFLANNLKSDNVRVISGNVLTGEKIEKDGYVGFYDNLVTVIPEGDDYIFFGSFVPTMERLSFQRSVGLFSFLNKFINPAKEYAVNTNINGEHRAFVQTGVFEQVLPMDIYPVQLLKSIMIEDFDAMEGLGIYEVAEEDLALCEFVDVSKHEVQSIIRQGLDLMKNS